MSISEVDIHNSFRCAGEHGLVFGEDIKTGELRHISTVPNGKRCECKCVACNTTLIAKHGTSGRMHHFAHEGGKACIGASETALHKFAKEVLAERKILSLPAVKCEFGGKKRGKDKKITISFEGASIECNLNDIVPDILFFIGSDRLAVEICVTHKVDEEKKEKILKMNLSTVEIFLGNISLEAPLEEIIEAIIHTAPREWIYNRKISEMEREIKEEIAAEKKTREEKILQEASIFAEIYRNNFKVNQLFSRLPSPEILEKINTFYLRDYIGIQISGQACFAASPSIWQAAILNEFILEKLPSSQYSRDNPSLTPKEILKYLKSHRLLAKEFAVFIGPDTSDAVRKICPGFISPYEAVETYLTELERASILSRSYDRKSRSLNSLFLSRCQDKISDIKEWERKWLTLETAIKEIISQLPEEEGSEFSLPVWSNTPLLPWGLSPRQMWKSNQPEFFIICKMAGEIRTMFRGFGKIPQDLIGLPITQAVERFRMEKEIQDVLKSQKEAEKAQTEKERRVKKVTDLSYELLPTDRELWLNSPHQELNNEIPLAVATDSQIGLNKVITLIKIEEGRQRRAQKNEEIKNEALKKLRDQALRYHGTEELADLFMESGQQKLNRKRPCDYCIDDKTLKDCLQLLKKH